MAYFTEQIVKSQQLNDILSSCSCVSYPNNFRHTEIEAVAEYPVLCNYNMTGSFDLYGENQFFDVQNVTPYSVDRLPEEITSVGKMYEELAMKYPLIFSNYIPTEAEMIDDVLKNQ